MTLPTRLPHGNNQNINRLSTTTDQTAERLATKLWELNIDLEE